MPNLRGKTQGCPTSQNQVLQSQRVGTWNQWVLQNESCPTMAPILPRPDKNIVAQFWTFGKLYKRLDKKEK